MALTNAGGMFDLPGPWFSAAYDGECDECLADFDQGDEIRRVDGGWQGRCCDDDTPYHSTDFDGTG